MPELQDPRTRLHAYQEHSLHQSLFWQPRELVGEAGHSASQAPGPSTTCHVVPKETTPPTSSAPEASCQSSCGCCAGFLQCRAHQSAQPSPTCGRVRGLSQGRSGSEKQPPPQRRDKCLLLTSGQIVLFKKGLNTLEAKKL